MRVVAMVLAALCGRASADGWGGRAAIGNDAFTSVTPPLDDQGFTNDLALVIQRTDGALALGGWVFHRMITSEDGSRRRWDQLDVRAALAWQWRPDVELAAWLGPSFGGDLGGRAIQNTWHAWSGTGPTIEQGLQNRYPGDRRIGAVLGGQARGTVGADLAAYADGSAQVALGTGVTLIALAAGGRVRHRWGAVTPGLHAELAVTRYHVGDPYLALPGGYRAGWQLEWRLGVEIAWSRYRISYEYRANEGGSGEPIGVVAFSW